MSCYLKEDEIEKYCGLTEGVTMAHVNAASYFIDSYKGCSYDVVRREERIEINKKGRGKIRHFPFAGIEKITARMESPFGESPVVLSENCIDFDSDDSPYFTFYMPTDLLFRKPPKAINMTYQSGYLVIPENVKKACGILACNIRQMGGTLRWKSRDDYDVKVTLSSEGIMTNDIKGMLKGIDVW